MSFSSIDKPSKYFNTITYTGTSASNSRTVGFQPDFFWFKNRGGNYHVLGDSVRGITKFLYSNDTSAEVTNTTVISSLNSTGYTLGDNSNASERVNYSGDSMVSWNWLGANTTVSNTSGTITSTVSANTTSGFSIVSYTGTGATATVGHGLGVAPKMIIIKNRGSGTPLWSVYHASVGSAQVAHLNSTAAFSASGDWNSTNPTSSLFSVGTSDRVNANTNTYIAYCFAEVKGYSKFGGYTGNNSLNNFVYTGFKPAFVMIKVTSTTEQWCMKDNKRNTINPLDRSMFANASNSEDYNTTNHLIDFVSNGFNLKDNTSQNLTNGSGQTYAYMAFAESPFVSSKGIPTTAR